MYNKVVELIEKKDVVSFDIFDTLVFRNIAKPLDIFRIVENIVKKEYNIDDFARKRIEAESNARKIVENGEASYDEIYIQLKNEIKDENIIKNIKKCEKEIEEKFIVQNPFMKKIFEYCVEKNKKIILISDMYLDVSFIKKILKNCGYSDNYKIYVSCESRKNKGSSELFKFVQNKEKLNFNKWIHIGDNYNSDYVVPKSLGMEAFNYKNVDSYENVEYDSVFESIIIGTINNFLYNGNEIDYWNKFGIKYLTPLYIGFTNWIYQMTYKCDNIYFLARGGYVVKKIFELFPNDKYIKYLYVSRNSIQIPAVLSGNSEDKIKFILSSIDGHITLKKLFNNCKLEAKKEYEEIIKLYGFDSFDNEIKDRQRYDALKCVCSVLSDAKDKIKADKEIVKKYLEQEGLNNFDTINVIDIGWGGSIQASIQKILNKKVRGYYLGTINRSDYDFYLNSFGYLFDQDNDIYDKSVIFSQVMMYELIFSAPHGSVNRYEEKDGKIVPVLKKQDDYSEIVDKFQNASLKVIKEIMKYYKYYDNINKKFAVKFYQEFLSTYNWDDLVKFSSIENDCFIGNDKKFPYVQILQKQFVIDNFKKLEEITDKSLWKGAFLIEGCRNKEEHNLFLEKTRKMYYPELYPSRLRMTLRKIIPLNARKALKKTYKTKSVKE